MSDSSWATTWRDVIVPLLCPKPAHAWWRQTASGDRQRVTLRPSMDAEDPAKNPRK